MNCELQQCCICVYVGAVPLATVKLVDETAGSNQATESWRHLLIHEVRSEGEHTLQLYHCCKNLVVEPVFFCLQMSFDSLWLHCM